MADQAKVTSIDVLESFRARMIVFLTKSRRAVDEATDEIRRTRNWLQGDQRVHWEAQVKKRKKILEQAEAELMTARFSEFVDTPSVQQMAVRKARRALEEAEGKLAKVKAWTRDYDAQADPLAKRLESIRFVLDQELPRGVTYLSQAQRTLEGYTEMPFPESTAPPVVPTEPNPPAA